MPTTRREDVGVEVLEDIRRQLAQHGAELAVIRRLLERQARPSPLTRVDQERLAVLLPALSGALGSEWFLCRDLFERECVGLRLVLGDTTTTKLGRLLRRAEGVPIGGYAVERGGVELGAVLWRIVATVEGV